MKMFKQCQSEICSMCQTHKKFPDEYIHCPICGEYLIYTPSKKVEKITDKQIEEQLLSHEKEADEILKDPEKFERFLQRLSKKLKHIPVAGTALSDIPMLISLVKSYVNKEYIDIPIGTIIAILCALIYFVSPVDLIPDAIPVIGLTDDALLLGWVLKMVHDDVLEYKKWLEYNDKIVVDDYE